MAPILRLAQFRQLEVVVEPQTETLLSDLEHRVVLAEALGRVGLEVLEQRIKVMPVVMQVVVVTNPVVVVQAKREETQVKVATECPHQ
jgi:hypothetical protein